ncbi:MAG: hypothetical protein L3J28_09010 [Candidatus Polarisedimenticolaceae bacterium]|nr:hypothetical protein [Candidatus Polarisedimenticolaceae bacterium]
MSNSWQKFIEAYPTKVLAERAALCDLSHLGLLKLSGSDAEQFLQGQLTNDVKQLTDTHSHLTGYCTAKGRLLAIFRAFHHNDAFYLQAPAEIIESLQKRLQMFIMMSEVKLELVSEQLPIIGLIGDETSALLQAHISKLPEGENNIVHDGDITLIRHPGSPARYQIIAPLEVQKALWSKLEAEADVVKPEAWSLLDIKAGIPNIYATTQEVFVPQMTNLHLIDGVSFTKGCYVGQEIVARLQYLGKQKRNMYPATVTTDEPPQVGATLFSSSNQSSQGAGTVVDVQAEGDQYQLLIIIQNESADKNDVQLSENGPTLQIRQPPYELTDSSTSTTTQ